MKNERLENMALPLSKLEPKLLRTFFITHLNRLYGAKSHIAKRLPELAGAAHFSDLKYSILEVCDEIMKQMRRMDDIYGLLGINPSVAEHSGWTGVVDDAIDIAEQKEPYVELRDLSILYFMQNLEALEMSSFKVLQLAAEKMKNGAITQLLKENYDEAQADRALMMQIMSKYVAG